MKPSNLLPQLESLQWFAHNPHMPHLFQTKLRRLLDGHEMPDGRPLTVDRFAEELKRYGIEVSPSTVGNWTNPKSRYLPDAAELAAICRYFRVDPNYLLYDHYPIVTAATAHPLPPEAVGRGRGTSLKAGDKVPTTPKKSAGRPEKRKGRSAGSDH